MQVSVFHNSGNTYWFQDGKLKSWGRINKSRDFGSHQSMNQEELENFLKYIEKRFSSELENVEVHTYTSDKISVYSWTGTIEEF